MEELNELFIEYDNNIKLNESDYDKMRKKRNLVLEEIRKDDNVMTFTPINLGSYKLKTGVKYKDNDYDIDCGIRLNINCDELDQYDAEDCKNKIYEAIKEYREKKYKNKCITVKYYEQGKPSYHIDFPVFAYDSETKVYYLADGKKGNVTWAKSNPEELIEYLYSDDDNYRRIVRLFKKWNSKAFENEKKHSKAPSVALTIEVREWFDENNYDNDIDALIEIAKRIKNLIIGNYIYKKNPFGETNLYYKMVEDEKCVSVFKSKIEEFINVLEETKKCVETSLYDASIKLKKVFQNFPEPKKEKVKESFGANARYA